MYSVHFANISDINGLVNVRFDYFKAENKLCTARDKELITSQLLNYYPKHINHDFFASIANESTGRIISSAFLVIVEKPANLSFITGKTGIILNVLTLPEYRRKGYAEAAVKQLISKAKEYNLSYLELSATDMGKPLYEKLGFGTVKNENYTNMRLNLK